MSASAAVPRTMPEAYAARLRANAGDPLVTFYDLATGERVELSATTWVNWAAKVAGLLTDELDLERGARLRIDLGTHWQAGVLLGGAWWAGIETVGPDAPGSVDATACAEADVERHQDGGAVLALSLKPMSGPCGPLPPGVLDFGREVLAMPDAYAPLDPPEPSDAAWTEAGSAATQADLLASPSADRVLTDAPPAGALGARLLGGALAGSGSLVLVRRRGGEVPASLPEQERVTRTALAG